MEPLFLVEICVDTYESALMAEKFGATRVELCSSLSVGGITPPLSLIQKVCSVLKIPVHIMIRPRAGDFLFSSDEFELMKADIRHAQENGAAGAVFGILKKDGTIDIERCRTLVAIAAPMNVTFHRAFDMTADPILALEEIVSLNIGTILTSGQHQSAEDGLEVIRELVKRAGNRVSVMAGGGVNEKNVLLLREAGVREFHFTARRKIPGKMLYRNEILQSMGSNRQLGEYDIFEFDEEKVTTINTILKSFKSK